MPSRRLIVAFAVIGMLVAGCGPTVTVLNNTRVPVRAVVTHSGGSEVVSPSPGESSYVDASEGSYVVSVIPDQEWIDYAKTVRKYLNDQLANSDKLTGPQLLDVIARLKDIAGRMQQYEAAAKVNGASCSGRISSDSAGIATISIGANGGLAVTCK